MDHNLWLSWSDCLKLFDKINKARSFVLQVVTVKSVVCNIKTNNDKKPFCGKEDVATVKIYSIFL